MQEIIVGIVVVVVIILTARYVRNIFNGKNKCACGCKECHCKKIINKARKK